VERLNEMRIGARLADGTGVRASVGTRSSLHAQHGTALFVGLDGDVTVCAPGAAPVHGRVVIVPPDVANASSSVGPTVGFIYDPESVAQVADVARDGGIRVLDGRLGARVLDAVRVHQAALADPDTLLGLSCECAAWMRDRSPRRRIDRRVARVVEAIRAPDGDRHAAIAATRLSPAHLAALFVRDIGLPMRSYALWRKLLAAVVQLAPGDATAAAHGAGFADLAHFSRTCRRMLGYTPTALRDGILGIQRA
jgi:AraC-like DNA-binding protein